MNISLEIAGDRVTAIQDGVPAQSAPLGTFLSMLLRRAEFAPFPDPIPDGVRYIRSRGDTVALVIEEIPQVRTVRWLADDSPVPFGPQAVYRTARLAFPFVVVIAVLRHGGLTGFQQCFYRTAPLGSLSDPLLLPNLYNVARTPKQPCWLCLVKLRGHLNRLPWNRKVAEIRKHMWGAGFNKSSEVHEGNSYWTTMRVDPRVSSLDRWERQSASDPFFPLKVSWPPAGVTAGQVIDDMLNQVHPARCPATVAELAALITQASAKPAAQVPYEIPWLIQKLAGLK